MPSSKRRSNKKKISRTKRTGNKKKLKPKKEEPRKKRRGSNPKDTWKLLISHKDSNNALKKYWDVGGKGSMIACEKNIKKFADKYS